MGFFFTKRPPREQTHGGINQQAGRANSSQAKKTASGESAGREQGRSRSVMRIRRLRQLLPELVDKTALLTVALDYNLLPGLSNQRSKAPHISKRKALVR